MKNKPKLSKIIVPIFTEEYKVIVAFGTVEQLAKLVAKTCDGLDYQNALERCKNTRGCAWNRLAGEYPEHPLITVNADLDYKIALAVIPHEALHAVKYISDFIGIDDKNGEFEAHGISAIMRYCTKFIFKK